MNNNSYHCLMPKVTNYLLPLPTREQSLTYELANYTKSIKINNSSIEHYTCMIGLLQNKVTSLKLKNNSIRKSYKSADFELSKLDGRYQLTKQSKVTKQTKAALKRFTQDQILAIAAALKVKMEGR